MRRSPRSAELSSGGQSDVTPGSDADDRAADGPRTESAASASPAHVRHPRPPPHRRNHR
jgi:hypothetical protein